MLLTQLIAKVVEEMDRCRLINISLGMAIDLKLKTIVGNTFEGFSGPAVKPVALRMVYQVYKAVNIPIVGMRISSTEDALEFYNKCMELLCTWNGIFLTCSSSGGC